MKTESTIIEIGGVKLEVDLRTAKVVENYKVGDNVRLLIKDYGDKYKVCPGVIVSFDAFQKLPTIVVAYLELDYSGADVKFATINNQSKDDGYEIAPANYIEETHFRKSDVLAKMQSAIDKKVEEIKDLERKRAYFLENFAKYFQQSETTA